MSSLFRLKWLLIVLLVFVRCDNDDSPPGTLELLQIFAGPDHLDPGQTTPNIPVDRSFTLVFSVQLDEAAAASSVRLLQDAASVPVDINLSSDKRTLALRPQGILSPGTTYTIEVSSSLKGAKGESFPGQSISFTTATAPLTITSAAINGESIISLNRVTDVPLDLSLQLEFSAPINPATLEEATSLSGPGNPTLSYSYSNQNQTVMIKSSALRHLSKFVFRITNALKGNEGQTFSAISKTLYTAVDITPKFPVISDDALLNLVQEQTFKYFWDFAHPSSGMARERNTSGDVITSGGSGFGIMSLIVGIERNFITREEGLQRMDKILTFLEGADRFHGAWSHWINGNTGKVVPFSANDNGGDLVETSFLMQGLLAFRQYLDGGVPNEKTLVDRINALWETVEWDWYTRGGQNVLYWHWSPDKQWTMNHPIRGYNEALITYFLAAASPTHSIDADVYHEGWAMDGGIQNGKEFYGIVLPLGYDFGGPLFFAHYSFLGLDPRNLADTYANYWTQNVNHSKINHAYAAANPKSFVGYSESNWGLTASDNHQGYSAHSPTNDLGVITPTAALSSFPYTPDESMAALKFFYYTLGDRLWGQYGFYDAFNITEGWTADSYLAIDQGPIIVMIENYRTGLLWDLFMTAPEVQIAMDKLGFTR